MKKEQAKSRYEILMGTARRMLVESGWGDKVIQEAWATPYELLLEADISRVVNRIVFRANGDRMNEFITEIRLPSEDVFIFDRWGLYLLNTEGADDINFREHTFPDADYFKENELGEAEIFYKSQLSLVINNQIILPGICTDHFRSIEGADDRSMNTHSDCGMIDLDLAVMVVLMGSKKTVFNLDLPRKPNLATSQTRLRLRLSGILIRNAVVIG